MLTFRKIHYDRGNCRTYYVVVGDRKKKVYCRYDGEDMMLSCSKYGEPSHPIGNTQYIVEDKPNDQENLSDSE